MSYKGGDKDRVREDLVVGQLYGVETFVGDMSDALGKTATIKDAICEKYEIMEYGYSWTDEMLEPLEKEFTIDDLKVSDLKDGSIIHFSDKKLCVFKGIILDIGNKREFIAGDEYLTANVSHKLCKITKITYGNETVYERPKEYLTLEESSKTGKKMKHKDGNVWCVEPQNALANAIGKTKKSMFEVLQLREFEVKD